MKDVAAAADGQRTDVFLVAWAGCGGGAREMKRISILYLAAPEIDLEYAPS